MFQRLVFRVLAPDTGLTYLHICCKNCIDYLKRQKINKKDVGNCQFFKKNVKVYLNTILPTKITKIGNQQLSTFFAIGPNRA